MSAADRIKSLRLARGWSFQKLADRCDRPAFKQQLQKLEAGQSRMTEEWLLVLARAFEVSPAELLDAGPVVPRGLAEAADAYAAAPADGDDRLARMFPGRTGLLWWRCASTAMDRAGILPGDWLVVDPAASPQPGAPVIAQVVDEASGTAETVLRRWHGSSLDPVSDDARHAAVPTRPRDGRLVAPILPVITVLREY
jgi:transcriptional regulator with XRE-family HTH domain